MIKDVFILSKNSWHVRYIKWVWNYDYYNFRNMCPYFWLTALSCLLVLPILVVKLFRGIGVLIINLFTHILNIYEKYLDMRNSSWVEENLEKIKEDLKSDRDSELLTKLYYNYLTDFFSQGSSKYYILWLFLNYDERESLVRKEEKLYIEKKQFKREVKQRRQKTREEVIGSMIPTIKVIVKLLIGGSLIGISYYLILGIDWLIHHINIGKIDWSAILNALFLSIIIILAAFIGVMITIVSIKLLSKVNYSSRKQFSKVFGRIFGFIKSIFISSWKGILFLYEILVAMKKDNCPGLEWKD